MFEKNVPNMFPLTCARSLYQDTDFGKDAHAGVVAQLEAMGLKLAGAAAHRPTDTEFNAPLPRLYDAGCGLICLGTIVKDTTIIPQTTHKMGWNVEFCGQSATYSAAICRTRRVGRCCAATLSASLK